MSYIDSLRNYLSGLLLERPKFTPDMLLTLKPTVENAKPVADRLETLGGFSRHEAMYFNALIRPQNENIAMLRAQTVLKHKARYKLVADSVGVPWYLLGCIHALESGNDFKGVLHNGEKIIGTGRKTTLVPRGRGPFTSWESAAVDAILSQWRPEKWGLGEALEFLERWNGLGYRRRGVNSPYLWSMTTLYTKGRFVADGKYDANSVSRQVGACAILKCLEKLGELEVKDAGSQTLQT